MREKYNLSQEAMAFKCGMHAEHISKMERGKITPSFETILKIASAFSMPMTVLLSLNDKFLEMPEEKPLNTTIIKINDILEKLTAVEQEQILKIVQTFIK